MFELMKSIDQANGYLFGELEDNKGGNFSQLMSSAVGTDFEFFRLVKLQYMYMYVMLMLLADRVKCTV